MPFLFIYLFIKGWGTKYTDNKILHREDTQKRKRKRPGIIVSLYIITRHVQSLDGSSNVQTVRMHAVRCELTPEQPFILNVSMICTCGLEINLHHGEKCRTTEIMKCCSANRLREHFSTRKGKIPIKSVLHCINN